MLKIGGDEKLIGFAAAAAWAAEWIGQPVSKPTLQRWATEGFRGTKLETVHVGRRVFTSAEAIRRFLGRVNGNMPGLVAAAA
jgi:hypothetical protein